MKNVFMKVLGAYVKLQLLHTVPPFTPAINTSPGQDDQTMLSKYVNRVQCVSEMPDSDHLHAYDLHASWTAMEMCLIKIPRRKIHNHYATGNYAEMQSFLPLTEMSKRARIQVHEIGHVEHFCTTMDVVYSKNRFISKDST